MVLYDQTTLLTYMSQGISVQQILRGFCRFKDSAIKHYLANLQWRSTSSPLTT